MIDYKFVENSIGFTRELLICLPVDRNGFLDLRYRNGMEKFCGYYLEYNWGWKTSDDGLYRYCSITISANSIDELDNKIKECKENALEEIKRIISNNINRDFTAIINTYGKELIHEYLLYNAPDPVGQYITKHMQDIIKHHGIDFVQDQINSSISKNES